VLGAARRWRIAIGRVVATRLGAAGNLDVIKSATSGSFLFLLPLPTIFSPTRAAAWNRFSRAQRVAISSAKNSSIGSAGRSRADRRASSRNHSARDFPVALGGGLDLLQLFGTGGDGFWHADPVALYRLETSKMAQCGEHSYAVYVEKGRHSCT
jgi:hypothetical protein